MVNVVPPTASSRVQSAKPCGPIGASCNWPRQRLTLLNRSAWVPVQGSDVTVNSSGLPLVGIVIVAILMPVPGCSSQPSGSCQSGWGFPAAIRTLAKNSVTLSARSSISVSGATTLKNHALSPSGNMAANIRSVGSAEGEAAVNARHGLLGHVVRVNLFGRSAANRHHTDGNRDRSTMMAGRRWKPCRGPVRALVAWKENCHGSVAHLNERQRVGRSHLWPADDGLPRGPTHTGSIPRIIAAMPQADTADSAHGDDGRRNGSGPNVGVRCRMPEVIGSN